MAEESDFKFDEKLRLAIHRDWGNYYKRLGKNESARKQFLDCLSLKPNAEGPMEKLSKCHLERADTTSALQYANDYLKNYPKLKRMKSHRNECIYDSNEFECCLAEWYRMWQANNEAKDAFDAIKVTELTIEQSIGREIGHFLDNFREAIDELDKIRSDSIDDRPIWKIRRENNECDVLSVCSDSEKSIKATSDMHPRDLCRLKRKNKVFRSMYLSSPTTDTIEYLNSLIKDPRLEFPPSEESTKAIRSDIEEELAIVKKFEFKLRQRQPIYAKRAVGCKRNADKFSYISIKNIQEDTLFQAVKQLKRIEALKVADFPGLLKYAENLMTNFYLLKTMKVFPRKFEFLEQICNIIGTCYVQHLKTPSHILHNVQSLFETAFAYQPYVTIPTKFNYDAGFKNPINHFLKRLKFSNNPIERCYIHHELSRLYFAKEKYIESKEMGNAIIQISEHLPNYMWKLLGYLRVIVVDSWLEEFENVNEYLRMLGPWEKHFPNSVSELLDMIRFAVKYNNN